MSDLSYDYLMASHRKYSRQLQKRLEVKRVIIAYCLLIALTAFVALIFAASHHSPGNLQNPFPSAQIKAVPFQLYYPTRLPDHYQFDIASAESVEASVVVLRVTNPKTGDAIAISQQKAPDNFNFNILYNSFEAKKSYKVKLGTVVTGTIDNGKTQIASLVTADKTWIFLTAPAATPAQDLKVVLDHLQLVQKH